MQYPRTIPISPITFTRLALVAFVLFAGGLSVQAGLHYAGNPLMFAAFCVLGNTVLLNGLRPSALFFDTFIGIFLWLGFFLKLSLRLAFFDGRFVEPIGVFDGTGAAYDKALMVVIVAFLALLAASLARERVFRYPVADHGVANSALFRFYDTHRKTLLLGFAVLVAVVAASNAWLGIYQRGMATGIVLPWGMNGMYKWLLQFGLASASALIVRFEIERNHGKLGPTAVALPLVESFLCNISLLSRGMILNVGGLVAGTWRLLATIGRRPRLLPLTATALLFLSLFAVSIFAVNYIRAEARNVAVKNSAEPVVQVAKGMAKPLFIDRWVGMEGVLAVSSAPDLGWDLWNSAWNEKYDETRLSLYDTHFIESQYKDYVNKGNVHFVSLPGMVAFFFYPGSLSFLFCALLIAALAAALLEIGFYLYCGKNLVLCSLFAQVIAFRYASFGYVPAQSYLLLGTLMANGGMIWAVEFLLRRYRQESPAGGTS